MQVECERENQASQDHDLEAVEDFEQTDFRAALLTPPSRPKRKRKFDVGSCIIEPTYIPWPDEVGKPRQRLAAIKPHRVRQELVPDVEQLLSTGHKRYSWIIPVNGKLPSTVPLTSGIVVPPDATMVEELGDQSIVAASQAHGTKDRITWTPADLLLFWLCYVYISRHCLNRKSSGLSLVEKEGTERIESHKIDISKLDEALSLFFRETATRGKKTLILKDVVFISDPLGDVLWRLLKFKSLICPVSRDILWLALELVEVLTAQ
ncbi:hypothetical protein M407DRAFT_5532 [Tulasnella calospora MUT 4182]|uniref:Uncharacterized protein n=1 Tax=Tulasnella calospora MUT 4182 TaxID=1051891 RepID=A0A0C3QRW0_9AGAM|nr:hypothetical protein M407DRAFT_5532 [Tulasnella calospora MUT 4182]